MVASGSGKALVCVVGAASRRGAFDKKLDTTAKTPLQEKLANIGSNLTQFGFYAAAVILVANLLNFTLKLIFLPDYRQASLIINDLAQYLTLSITVIIVAVPEGLPLSIVIALAYSVSRMKNDGVLIKNLEAPERMANID